MCTGSPSFGAAAGLSAMSTRASKRKAGAPPASKPAAKRGGKGGRAAAAAAAGKGAAAAAPSGPPLYAVRCERQSKVVKWDEETFVDCYDDDEEPRDEVEGCAGAWDGVWLHDAAQRQWQHPAVSGSGQLRCFEICWCAGVCACIACLVDAPASLDCPAGFQWLHEPLCGGMQMTGMEPSA